MLSIPSILNKIHQGFPNIVFQESTEFRWSPNSRIIFYVASGSPALLLHELGHAALCHENYRRDIELITLERDAWSYAINILSEEYAVTITENEVQDSLDTYRDWLHARSLCPRCESTGLQTATYTYICIACGTTWEVNEARICTLRRRLKQNSALS